MGFRDARAAVIEALRSGKFSHEARAAQSETNLLAIGDIDPDFVVDLLRRARGDQYSESRHHWEASVIVHVFRCERRGVRWYVKVYFLESSEARFISVHRSASG